MVLYGMAETGSVGIDLEDVKRNFKFWSKHVSELESLPKNVSQEIKSTKDFKKALSKNKKR